ncbi:MAG: DUF3306 domain-containing protein [Gammaproteobacteria bacterium]|nr:MAG: DUF3306 domain-containing protein [Gammaproteobacteria bacterium]
MKQAEPESRLSRWSRRKRQTAEETQKEDLALNLEQQSQVENELETLTSEDQQNEAQQPVLSDTDMEPVEGMTEESDFSKFMSPGVSDELRNLALRKLFHAPIFNIRDGLDEYDGDYTWFEKLGDIVTADMRHQMELEANKKLEQEAREIAEAEAEATPDEQDPDGDIDQAPSIAAEDQSLEQIEDEPDLEGDEIPDQPTEKILENNE